MDKNIVNLLDQAGLKKTHIREDIIKLLRQSKTLYSAQDVYLKLVEHNKQANLSSVYRSLEKLVEAEIVNQVSLTNEKQALYEFNRHSHHHFLVCDDCNKVVIVDGCPIHEYEHQLEESHGFTITDHAIEFHGTCNDCQKLQERTESKH